MARVGTYLFAVLVLCLSELVIVTVSYYRFRLYQLLPGSIGSTYPRLTKMRKERDKAQKDRGSMDIFHACVNFQTETSNLYILRDIHIEIVVSSSSSYKYHACDVTIPYATATMAATISLGCL